MPIEIPKADKVYTTVYDNFKGVDFTNDSTNVWRKRSPDGYNMLPDDSGRPFKRTGWEVVVTNDMIFALTNKEDTTINKCCYFELNGEDHIILFVNGGVLVYRGDNLYLLTDDPLCYSSFERAFFFEGNGKSVFYIYGSYKVWEYFYDPDNSEYIFGESESLSSDYLRDYDDYKITVPLVMYSASASSGVGEILENFNMLGNLAEIRYENNSAFFSRSDSTTFTHTVDKDRFDAWLYANTFTFEFDDANTKWVLTTVSGSTTTTQDVTTTDINDVWGITITGTPADQDKIVFRRLVSSPYYYTTSQVITFELDFSKVDTWLKNPDDMATPNPNSTYYFEWQENATPKRWDLTVTTFNGSTTTTQNVDISKWGIDILGSPTTQGDFIEVKYIYGVVLPTNVAQSQIGDVTVKASKLVEFDNELTVVAQNTTPTVGQVSLHTDSIMQKAWLQFYSLETPLVEGEDAISVVYPTSIIDITPVSGQTYSGSCTTIK